MGILSKSAFSAFRENAERSKPYNWLNESVSAKSRAIRVGEVTIFLSHKHDESSELKNAIAFLNSFGVSVYVDWMDEGMPKTTSGATAIKIKTKIKEKHKFLFLATEGAISSKWCNWELGFGDAHKYVNSIALLPIKENMQNYTGSEYLQIYPYIYENDSFKGTFYVKYPDGNIINFVSWLKK
jgi:hypothetical protein